MFQKYLNSNDLFKFQRQSVHFSFVIIDLKTNAFVPKITQIVSFLAATNRIFSKMNAEIG